MTIEPGQILNQYRLTEKIGAGGMGEVWAAEDSSLKRKVAIKILPPETADHPERRARFTREAQSVAALNHPNIVTIHSVEESGGVHFLTMEYVDGDPLTKRIGREGLTLSEFFELAIPLSDAVAAAHEQGITHRDLKPDNVMITRDGRVKVLDFGLAKLTAPEGSPTDETELPTQTVTKEGRIVGTVNYMAPEQAEGKSTDARSDVFSLGILIYEMTTGTRPFSGDTAISTITSILRDTPAPVREMRTDLPPHLDRVIRRCLAKEPERRYQSALELRNELEELRTEIQSGEELEAPVVPPRPSGEMAAPRAARRFPTWAIVTIVAILAVVVIVALDRTGPGGSSEEGSAPVTSVGKAADDEPTMIVVLPFENLGKAADEYFADGITEEITARLASVSGLGVISRNSAFRYDRSGKTTSQIGADFGVDYVLEGSVRWAGDGEDARVRIIPSLVRVSDDVGVWSEPFNEVLDDVFEVQSDIASSVAEQLGVALQANDRDGVEKRPTESPSAYQAYLRGLSTKRLSDDQREWTESAIRNFRRATELDPSFTLAWAELSIAHSRYHHFGFDRTAERQQMARRAVDRALELDRDLPQAHKALGFYHYWSMKDYEPALQAFAVAERGLAGDEELVSGIGYVYRRQGRFEEAAQKLREAARLNPQDASAYRNLGETLACLRQFDEAIEAYEKAIIIAPEQAESPVALAQVHRIRNGDERRSEESLAAVPAAADRAQVDFGYWSHHLFFGNFEEAARVAAGLNRPLITVNEYLPVPLMAAQAKRLAGEAGEAETLYGEALAELDRQLVERPDDYRLHAARGVALAGLGRHAEGIASAERAVEIYPISKDALAGTTQLEMLARVYAMSGERSKALEVADRLLKLPSWNTDYGFRNDGYWSELGWSSAR